MEFEVVTWFSGYVPGPVLNTKYDTLRGIVYTPAYSVL